MKRIAMIIVASMAAIATFAQTPQQGQQKGPRPDGKGWGERMEAEKVAFYTKYIGLTPEEAQLFWPIYNEAEKEQKAIARENREAGKALNQALAGKIEGADIAALTKAYVATLGKRVDNQKYFEFYSQILPAEKVAKVFLAEEKFRRQQIQRLSEGGPQGGYGRPDSHGPQAGGRPDGGHHPQGSHPGPEVF